ncbi:MAG: VWA domain-containing protein [Sulfuriflexus sp.]|nr:VWA domain-containing protein [Sulfuriflexus sp.]
MKINTTLKPIAIAVASAVFMLGCMATDKDSISHTEQGNHDRIVTTKPAMTQSAASAKTVAKSIRHREALRKRKAKHNGIMTFAHAPQSADLSHIRQASESLDRENYKHLDKNPIKIVAEQSVSTFSIDVDTGAYSNVRRFLNQGNLPREDAVRIEELVNYFSYDYPQPKGNHPFSVTTEISATPWNKNTLLLHVGVQGKHIAKQNLPPSNLVFLIDVSGSMHSANKLQLLKTSMKLLSKQLRPQDKVSIVVYAGASGVVLPPTAGDQTAAIHQALDQLSAGGSTNGAAGIKLAYQMAAQGFVKNGINRVIIATDGDFNVGTTNFRALIDLIEEKRKGGVSLTTLGFGMGNYNDHLMEQIADAGNGNYAYIDTINEAQKVLVDEISSTLNTIAKDVKIQIEFNPSQVAEYRLLGYENRLLKREDFNNDKIDAGEIGAGHSVTALYEISLVGSKGNLNDPLRYGLKNRLEKSIKNNELAFLRLRYKQPDGDKSTLIEQSISRQHIQTKLSQTSDRFRFSASVAAFGQQLRGADYLKDYGYTDILELARHSRGNDPFGYRGEFVKLVNLAKSLDSK